MASFVDPTKESFAEFRERDRQGPVQMLNLIRLNKVGRYPDGRRVSGPEAYEAYSLMSAPVFNRLGGKIHWQGKFELMLIGPSDENWDICFIAEYPSVASFVEMVRDPIYREAAKHRQAAVADSRLIRLEALKSGSRFGEIPN